MPTLREFTFPSSDNQHQIYVREWTPDGAVRGIVQLAHGIAEHIARYDGFAQFLAEHGFLVAGNDHLGHGKSAADESEIGVFAENGGWQYAVSDMRTLTTMLQEAHPETPTFLFGHSMGSFLTRTYIINWRTGLSGAVISGTGQQSALLVRGGEMMANLEVRQKGHAFKSERLNTMAFGKYNDGIAHPNTACDWLSRDTEVVDKYVTDPLCGWVPSAGMFRDMMGGIKFISAKKNVKRMNPELPVLFVSGEADPVGENGKGVMRAYRSFIAAGMSDVTLKLYPGGRHEMLNEINKDQVFEDVLAWLESKM